MAWLLNMPLPHIWTLKAIKLFTSNIKGLIMYRIKYGWIYFGHSQYITISDCVSFAEAEKKFFELENADDYYIIAIEKM